MPPVFCHTGRARAGQSLSWMKNRARGQIFRGQPLELKRPFRDGGPDLTSLTGTTVEQRIARRGNRDHRAAERGSRRGDRGRHHCLASAGQGVFGRRAGVFAGVGHHLPVWTSNRPVLRVDRAAAWHLADVEGRLGPTAGSARVSARGDTGGPATRSRIDDARARRIRLRRRIRRVRSAPRRGKQYAGGKRHTNRAKRRVDHPTILPSDRAFSKDDVGVDRLPSDRDHFR
jgi:hypothetical protein